MTTTAVNPIIPGFAPDPSCIRVGNTYYLVNSTFNWFPGLPIYTSTDLVSWKHIGNAINRPSQGISFAHSRTRINPPSQWDEHMTMTGGLYAPTIRHRDGTFYVVCTNIIHDFDGPGKDKRQNFIVTSTDIESDSWSDPIFFDLDGIDTCIFWDVDGRSYIHGTAIQLFEIDLQTGKKLSEQKTLWSGTGGVYPEGPHLIHKDGWYYLLISEGGCFEDHAITGARSRSLWGPYEAYEHNPLLTARGTDEYVRNIGHSDLFQDAAGNWWAVALGIRKEPQKGRYLMGRETFLTPVSWSVGEWPHISQIKIAPVLDADHVLPTTTSPPTLTAAPGVDLLYLRDPDLSKYRITNTTATGHGRKHTISLTASPADLSQGGPTDHVTFVGKRMRALAGRSQATLLLNTAITISTSRSRSNNLKAGLALCKDECRFARIYYSSARHEIVFEVRNEARSISRETRTPLVTTTEGEAVVGAVSFRLDSTEEMVRMSYSVAPSAETGKEEEEAEEDGEHQQQRSWQLAGELDTLELTGLDFTGPVIGVFAVGEGDAQVTFEGFSVQ